MNYFFLKGRGADLPGNMLGLIFLGPLGGLLVVTSRWCPPPRPAQLPSALLLREVGKAPAAP